ncbi:Cell surface glycoprotein CD200 receptor 1-B [Lonchura striata]|uniref:Cell surface glycoprotein CD200 receptor 1-B n=1 Tax=Lonchura striata TaxID=40157 RepID=A0A218UX87_9PASE|nr:Cell surface glycoprotein CD200 receptor 1-B [Lonchura striata domestica]
MERAVRVDYGLEKMWAVVIISWIIFYVKAHKRVSVEAGHEVVLSCPNISKVPLLLVTWKRNCKSCYCLSYRRDQNETRRLNCSERITWKYSPVTDPALRIYPVNLGDEGIYTCEFANSEGNFHFLFSLIVIVPPMVTLTRDESRVAACQASAGKPAADISWIPASNHSSEEEFQHPNGTVTRVSYFGWTNSSFPSVTCQVTHAAMNQTLVIDLKCAECVNSDKPPIYLCEHLEGGNEEHIIYENTRAWEFPPSRARREAVKPPGSPENIYANYNPRSIYVFLGERRHN